MKLHTTIKPRRDGTVRATSASGQTFVFSPGEDGELTCDVTDRALAAALLATGHFLPADEAEFEQAAQEAAQVADAANVPDPKPAAKKAPARKGAPRA